MTVVLGEFRTAGWELEFINSAPLRLSSTRDKALGFFLSQLGGNSRSLLWPALAEPVQAHPSTPAASTSKGLTACVPHLKGQTFPGTALSPGPQTPLA